MRTSFTPRQIDAFVTCAELGNFTLAARRLHLTASAISNQIRQLETLLGFSVFERTTRRVTLTSEGREFLPVAIAVQRQLSAASLAAQDVRNHLTDVIRIAAPLSVAACLLPNLIASFCREKPNTRVRVLDTGVEWLSDRVANGEADLALGPDRISGPDVDSTPLFASNWVLWCAPDHPLAGSPSVRWADTGPWDFYAVGRDHEHSVVLHLPQAHLSPVQPVQIVENITTALGLAAAGLGYTCSPAYVESLASAMNVVMRPLIDPVVTRWMTLYTSRERNPSDSASAFIDHILCWRGETVVGTTSPAARVA